MGQFSIAHMVILFVIVLIIFGPKNLPKVGQALGRGIREFKDAARGLSDEIEADERRAEVSRRQIDYPQRPNVENQPGAFPTQASPENAEQPRDNGSATS